MLRIASLGFRTSRITPEGNRTSSSLNLEDRLLRHDVGTSCVLSMATIAIRLASLDDHYVWQAEHHDEQVKWLIVNFRNSPDKRPLNK